MRNMVGDWMIRTFRMCLIFAPFATANHGCETWRVTWLWLHHDGPRLLMAHAAFHMQGRPYSRPIMDSRGAVDAVDGAP